MLNRTSRELSFCSSSVKPRFKSACLPGLMVTCLLPIYSSVAADCTDAARKLAEAVRQGLDGEATEGTLRSVISICPELAEAHFNLGSVLLDRKRTDEAITALKKSIELKRDPLFLTALGNAHFMANHLGDAVASYQEALKLDSKSVKAMLGVSAVQIKQEKFQEAEDILRRAIQIAPDDATLFFNLGIVLEQGKRREEAQESFKAATARKPSYTLAQLHLASITIQLGEFEEANRLLKPLTVQEARNPLVWTLMAAAAEGMHEYGAALSNVDRALTIDPQLLSAQVNRGILLIKSGNLADGMDRLKSLAETHHDVSTVLGALGWGYLQEGNFESAEPILNKAIERDPNNAFAHNNLGVIYSQKGDNQKAKSAFARAKELLPLLKESRENLGVVIDSQ